MSGNSNFNTLITTTLQDHGKEIFDAVSTNNAFYWLLKSIYIRGFFVKIFVDSANVEKIRQLNEMGIIDGVTTNPTLVSQEGKPFKQILKEICSIVDGPISAETVSLDAKGMLAEAEGRGLRD